MRIYRGDVWWWNCPSHRREHIQEGVRPVVVVSNNICNEASDVITVMPLTSRVKKPYPQQVPVVFNGAFSIVLADQITSIPIAELGNFAGHLADFQMEQVDNAIAVQLSLGRHRLKNSIDCSLSGECEDGSC